MEEIDTAYVNLEQLLAELQNPENKISSEADVRLKIVDPMLKSVLGWTDADISTEVHGESGYTDYSLSVGGLTICILETKNPSIRFGFKREHDGKLYKLNGPVFNEKTCQDAILQVSRYTQSNSASLSVVSNGLEWAVFLGNRDDGVRPLDGYGICFSLPDGVKDCFKLFWTLLARQNVQGKLYKSILEERSALSHHAFFERPVSKDGIHLMGHTELAKDLQRVFKEFFQDISQSSDTEYLAECFVESRESKEADESLTKIAQQLIQDVTELSQRGEECLADAVKSAAESKHREFVLVIGNKGCGKSHYIHRFFSDVLPEPVRKRCLVVFVDLVDTGGNSERISDVLDQLLVEEIERQLFGSGGPTFDDLKGIFRNKYERFRNAEWKAVYDRDPREYDERFGQYLHEEQQNNRHNYLIALLMVSVHNRQLMPCLIFDNVDHFPEQFQERVQYYAQAIYSKTFSFVILPITDFTVWQLRKQGPLQSGYTLAFYLPAPSPKEVLKKRVEYIGMIIDQRKEKGEYALGPQKIRWRVADLKRYASTVQHVLVDTDFVARWIGRLTNHDIRRCLDLSKNIMCSPHIPIEELFKAYTAGESLLIDGDKIQDAIIRPNENFFSTERNSYVHNMFDTARDIPTSPLTEARILVALKDWHDSAASVTGSYVHKERAIEFFESMGLARDAILYHVKRLFDSRLIIAFEANARTIEEVDSLTISSAGQQHLEWARRSSTYLANMAMVTALTEDDLVRRLRGFSSRFPEGIEDIVRLFVHYLVEEDKKFVALPNKPVYRLQGSLVTELRDAWISTGSPIVA